MKQYVDYSDYTLQFKKIPMPSSVKPPKEEKIVIDYIGTYYSLIRSIEISMDKYQAKHRIKPNKIIIGVEYFLMLEHYIVARIGQEMKTLQMFGIDVRVDEENPEALRVAYEEDVGIYKFNEGEL